MLDEDERFTARGLCDLETLIEHCKCVRQPPLTPMQFNAMLDDKCFTQRGRDVGAVRAMYRRACQRMQAAVALDYSELGWGDDEAKQLAKVLGNGWGMGYKRLFLGQNKMGDEGIRAIAEGLRQGRATSLESIDIRGNPAKADARQAVRNAVDELHAKGMMLAEKVRIFGEPELSARLIQRRARAVFKVAAMASRRAEEAAAAAAAKEASKTPSPKPEKPRGTPRRRRVSRGL